MSVSLETQLFGGMVAHAAARYIDRPFTNHDATVNCGAQLTTSPECMITGLSNEGFDCSGLVIRAISDVIGQQPPDWAEDVRHVAQMARHGARISVREMQEGQMYPGQLLVFNHHLGGLHLANKHVAIYAGDGQMIHARSRDDDVVALEPTAVRGTSSYFAFAIDPLSLVR